MVVKNIDLTIKMVDTELTLMEEFSSQHLGEKNGPEFAEVSQTLEASKEFQKEWVRASIGAAAEIKMALDALGEKWDTRARTFPIPANLHWLLPCLTKAVYLGMVLERRSRKED